MTDRLRVSFELKYIISIIGIFVTVAAAIIYLRMPASDREVYLQVLSIIAVGIALTGFLYRVAEYHSSLQKSVTTFDLQRCNAAATLISEWHSPEMVKLTILGGSLREKALNKSPKEVSDLLAKDPESKRAIICILNFLEKMALLIDVGAVDKECCKRFFSVIVSEYYFAFSDFIAKQRTEYKSDAIFSDFEKLKNEWSS